MVLDLLESVQSDLEKRKADWRQIAADLNFSYEFVSRLGLGTYESSPTYERLKKLREYLLQKNRNVTGAHG